MAIKGQQRELYGTKQVAEILKIREWRVKNFSEGQAFAFRHRCLRVAGGAAADSTLGRTSFALESLTDL